MVMDDDFFVTWKFKFLLAFLLTLISELGLYLKYVGSIDPGCQELLPGLKKCVTRTDLILNIAFSTTFWIFGIALILIYIGYYAHKRLRWMKR
jgi:hypothetical protein